MKRFGCVVLFCKDVRKYKGLMLQYYRPEVFDGMGAPGDADSDVEEGVEDMGKVKMSAVSKALLDLEWWAYVECVLAVTAPTQTLMMFSRMCPCHPIENMWDVEQPELQWRQLLRRRTGQDTCAASGLQAPYFVCGKHMDVLAESSRHAHANLLSEMFNVSQQARANILEDYEKASNTLAYIVQLKFSSYQQLPLLLCGMAHECEVVARSVAQDVVKQYAATAGSSRQHVKVCELFKPGTPLAEEFQKFVGGEAREVLSHFKKFLLPLRLMRMNELSAERLHKVGTATANRAPHHGPCYVSCKLRAPELRRGIFDLSTLARCCERTCNEPMVLKEFQLSEHENVKQLRDVVTAAGKKWKSHHHGVYKLVRELFYRTDLPGLFSKHGDLFKSVMDLKAVKEADKKKMRGDPLASVSCEDSGGMLVADAIQCKYALQHWKETCANDSLYACPWSPCVQQMTEVLQGCCVDFVNL